MRTTLLLLVLTLAPFASLAAAELTRDDLTGFWVLDTTSVSKDQKDAAAAAQTIEGFGMVLTARIGRVTFEADSMIAGMWRVEDATATTATVIIQSKGGSEHSYQMTLTKKGQLQVAEIPGGLLLMRAP
ncbi:MAG: hypothetical protein PF961_19440 [Planctomycetota bacterium]|jgi:VCBS repeat-containing protein|nr:hypothetical protein [Planctomycetota bacterium]